LIARKEELIRREKGRTGLPKNQLSMLKPGQRGEKNRNGAGVSQVG